MEENKVHVKNQTNIAWMFWSAGLLFTAGTGAFDSILLLELSLVSKIVIIGWSCIIWPFALGVYFK